MNLLDRMALIDECDDVVVNVYGVDGNALCIIGACRKAMQRAGVSKRAQEVFFTEATSGNYAHVLKTCDLWCHLVHITPVESHGSIIGALQELGLAPEETQA